MEKQQGKKNDNKGNKQNHKKTTANMKSKKHQNLKTTITRIERERQRKGRIAQRYGKGKATTTFKPSKKGKKMETRGREKQEVRQQQSQLARSEGQQIYKRHRRKKDNRR